MLAGSRHCHCHLQCKWMRYHGWRSRKALWLHPVRHCNPLSLVRLFPTSYPIQHRCLTLDTVQALLLPPAIFGGLFVALWTYKCFMLVVFQNKIIYMPSVPPFSRSEEIGTYAQQCKPVLWREHSVRTEDGILVKLLEGSLTHDRNHKHGINVVTVYFQGNASSLPPRLPALSQVLKAVYGSQKTNETCNHASYTILALSYRGFWTSHGRPSQVGLERDAQAALEWICQNFNLKRTKIVLWGQSIGAGVATTAAARRLSSYCSQSRDFNICGLILETPFTSLRDMLVALYPQKYLPYRYLWPFLRSHWDSRRALCEISKTQPRERPQILILQAGKDEIVPAEQAEELERLCRHVGLSSHRLEIAGALHTEILLQPHGRRPIIHFLGRWGSR